MHIAHGLIPPAVLSAGGEIFLIHGGAGPRDPRGDRSIRAFTALREIGSALGEEPAFTSAYGIPAGAESPATRLALAAAQRLEDHPLFNAGYGAALQSDGAARVSASLMESRRRTFSGIINAEGIRHPSELALYLQTQRAQVIDGLGAAPLLRGLGVPVEMLITPARFEAWVGERRAALFGEAPPQGTGTIGCVALDEGGDLAAVTSTGGVGMETLGRVGDSPTVAGTYCGERVAISCTGVGEQILNQAFAARLATRVEDGAPLLNAFTRSLEEADARGYTLAAIALAKGPAGGAIAWAAGSTAPSFLWALGQPGAALQTALEHLPT